MKDTYNYNTSNIYKLCLKNNIEPKEDYKEFYGYSTLPLYIIFYAYENDYKRYKDNKIKYYSKAFKLFDDYGIENIDIIKIQNVECNNKKQLKEKYNNVLYIIKNQM